MGDKYLHSKFWKTLATIVGTALTVCAVIFLTVGSQSRYKIVSGVACAFLGLIFILLMRMSRQTGKEAELHTVNKELQNQGSGRVSHDLNSDLDD